MLISSAISVCLGFGVSFGGGGGLYSSLNSFGFLRLLVLPDQIVWRHIPQCMHALGYSPGLLWWLPASSGVTQKCVHSFVIVSPPACVFLWLTLGASVFKLRYLARADSF